MGLGQPSFSPTIDVQHIEIPSDSTYKLILYVRNEHCDWLMHWMLIGYISYSQTNSMFLSVYTNLSTVKLMTADLNVYHLRPPPSQDTLTMN